MNLKHIPTQKLMPVTLFQWRQSCPDRESLRESLQTHGFLTPLGGFELNGQAFLFDGYERFALAQELNLPDIPVNILPIDLNRAFINRLALNTNDWTTLEISHILNAAKQIFTDQEIAFKIAPLLPIQSAHHIKNYLRFRELPLNIKNKYGGYALSVLMKFFDFEETELDTLSEFVTTLNFNQNKLGEILDLFFDLKRKEKKSLPALLGEFSDLLKGITESEKTEKLRHLLKMKRYPHFETKKQGWEQLKKSLQLPREISLETSPYFENATVTVNAKINNKEDLKKLEILLESMSWEKMLNFLNES
ncbi:MAG: hypothetical protein ACD_73C00071G0004 [uncultured bacterium]|nr:MAG: hypothetical protein ACD_73C00071G0004 [uncultured bacterium]